MQTVPVFVISLKTALARRAAIERHLKELGIEYEMFDAILGSKIDPQHVKQVNPAGNMRPGVIGTYLSHMNIYEKILERDMPVALVLEDDAALNNSVCDLLREGCLNLDFDCCLLGCDDRGDEGYVYYDSASGIDLTRGLKAYELSSGPYCLHAYLITRKGAEKRLSAAFPARTPIDHYQFLSCELRFMAVIPMIAFVNEESAVGSVSSLNWSGIQARLRRHWWYYPIRDFLKFNQARKLLAMKRTEFPHPGQWRTYRSAFRVLK